MVPAGVVTSPASANSLAAVGRVFRFCFFSPGGHVTWPPRATDDPWGVSSVSERATLFILGVLRLRASKVLLLLIIIDSESVSLGLATR